MPIYEYKCNDCGNSFEKLVARDTGDIYECPKCESTNTNKKFSVFGGVVMSESSAGSCTSAPMCGAAGTGCGGHCQH
ncbi:MAG: zinc ribbon domain-containing protein [bacterium]|nr:zinc ribbon domain-containing protein [bacterium]